MTRNKATPDRNDSDIKREIQVTATQKYMKAIENTMASSKSCRSAKQRSPNSY